MRGAGVAPFSYQMVLPGLLMMIDITAAIPKNQQYCTEVTNSRGDILAIDDASNICAPHGIRPWVTQEKMSIRLAERLAGTL